MPVQRRQRSPDAKSSRAAVQLAGLAALLVGVALSGCQSKAELSAESRALLDRYHQVHDGMHEHVVDELFTGFPMWADTRELDQTRMLKPLKARSTFQKTFDERANAIECDYFVCIYFDEAGYVVGKDGGQYDR